MNELALLKQLGDESYFLRNVDWIGNRNKVTDKKLQQIRQTQNEKYEKYILLKKYREAKEILNEKISRTNV